MINLNNLRYGYCIIPWTAPNFISELNAQVLNFFIRPQLIKDQYVTNEMEYGYYHQGHKESFAIRDECIPEEFLICKNYLDVVHKLALDCLSYVAQELHLAPQLLLNLVDHTALPSGRKSDSLLRVIYYHGQDNIAACFPHQDLGLITLVLKSNVPALEIFKIHQQVEWINIESLMQPTELVVMVGETLAQVSNQYYIPATHQVCPTKEPRLSFVYQLRAKPSVVLNSEEFESEVTGGFAQPFKLTVREFVVEEMRRRESVNGSY